MVPDGLKSMVMLAENLAQDAGNTTECLAVSVTSAVSAKP
jgi:hypothetical protein